MGTQLPRRSQDVRIHYVVIRLNRGIHREFPDPEYPPDSHAEGDRPSIVAVSLPVGGNDRRRVQIPAIGHVIVDEVLHQKLVHIVTLAAARIRKGPYVLHQRAEHLGATHRQPHKGRASAPFLSTQALVCRGGEQEDGSSTPDKTAWIAWSDEQGLGDIAQAEFAALSGDEFRLVDERGDGA